MAALAIHTHLGGLMLSIPPEEVKQRPIFAQKAHLVEQGLDCSLWSPYAGKTAATLQGEKVATGDG